jgi:hypothetical protein
MCEQRDCLISEIWRGKIDQAITNADYKLTYKGLKLTNFQEEIGGVWGVSRSPVNSNHHLVNFCLL